MAKAAATSADKAEETIEKAPQAQPDFKPTANIVADNIRSDVDQPGLYNPNSEAIRRDAVADGASAGYNDALVMGQTKELKKPKPFKTPAEAMEHIGKQVVFHNGSRDQFGILEGVTNSHVQVSGGLHFPISQVSAWEGTPESKKAGNPHEGDPAWDVTVKHNSEATDEKEAKKAKEINDKATA